MKALDTSSATAQVAPDLLKALAILSDTIARRSAVDWVDLLEIRKKVRFRTQKALLSLIEKWKAILGKNGYARAVLMNLLKAFDKSWSLNSQTECLWFHIKLIKIDKMLPL